MIKLHPQSVIRLSKHDIVFHDSRQLYLYKVDVVDCRGEKNVCQDKNGSSCSYAELSCWRLPRGYKGLTCRTMPKGLKYRQTHIQSQAGLMPPTPQTYAPRIQRCSRVCLRRTSDPRSSPSCNESSLLVRQAGSGSPQCKAQTMHAVGMERKMRLSMWNLSHQHPLMLLMVLTMCASEWEGALARWYTLLEPPCR